MNKIEFEKLLGESISVFEKTIGNDFKKNPAMDFNSIEVEFYSLKDWNITKDLYGMPYRSLQVKKDKNNKIETIYISFNSIISRDFFDLFNAQYGKPNSIQIIAKRTLEQESINKNENGEIRSNSKKYSLDLKEGSFDEKPLYITWKKDDYEIKALLIHKEGRSKIIFSKVD
ncbi:hypothetical protein [Pontimicrobium sp. MEBiC06410]